LHVITLAAVQSDHVYAMHMFRKIGHCFSYLNRQFAGRSKYEDLRCTQARIDVVKQRKRKRCGFTATSLGHAQYVTTRQQCGMHSAWIGDGFS
jgi:hypothetical protein